MEFIEATLMHSKAKTLFQTTSMIIIDTKRKCKDGCGAIISYSNATPGGIDFHVKESYRKLRENFMSSYRPKYEKFTHQGIFMSIKDHEKKGFTQSYLLRETRLYWVREGGTKYLKTDGIPTAKACYGYRLILDRIEKLPDPIIFKDGKQLNYYDQE